MIEMKDVTKIYRSKNRRSFLRSETREVTAVQNLTLSIAPGEIVGLLGLNGAGKTTTIRMLSTLLEPTFGSIEVDGALMDKNRQEIQMKINMIAGGERMLYWRLTGRQNLIYFGKLYGLSAERLERDTERLLAEVGLAEAADRPVEQYSKGMKQRLQIARGLINDPAYLFLDEPTLGLDAPIARHLRSMVSRLAREAGKGILLTSHYLQEVEELCDRVYVLDNGRLLLCDKPETIVSQVAGAQTAHLEVAGWNDMLRPELARHLNGLTISSALVDAEKVESAEMDKAGTYRLSIKTPAADKLIAELLPWALEHDLAVTGFATEKPNLEDAIIKLSEG
ncbi:ABC transporter ATP-binding protein [Gorillibacterium massiliense]|uniref:ABC transporter ATP-binding protein n=1 Tax=Gorillibacterium massiliense TaxID=1280390 RepID=UPI0004BBD640|nr:ABC transporter ATP-binding protein [Gorillibacterium massiliense]